MKISVRTPLLLLAMLVPGSVVFAEPGSANWDEKAVEVLKQMDAYTDAMTTYVVSTESYHDESIGPGLVISNPVSSRITVDRPGSLHSVSRSASTTSEIYLHEGKLTVFSAERNFYTRADVPAALDEGLLFSLEKFDVEMPLLDLLVLKSLDRLVSEEMSVRYVSGDSAIRGVTCHLVLISGPNVDMQIWIEKGENPVPRRTLMTYKQGAGMPRNDVFIDWKAAEGFAATEFNFEPPEGAIEIGFINAQ